MKPVELFLVILLSIGAIQGCIYGIILWINKGPNAVANKFLASILFFFSYRLIVEILKHFGIGYYDFFYHYLNNVLIFPTTSHLLKIREISII